MCDGPDLFLCVLSILFPPLGVWVKRGVCSADSLINIALCCLGYLPGLIHAWYIISTYPHIGYDQLDGGSDGHVQIYYVRGGPPPPSAGPAPGGHTTPQAGYGTIGGGSAASAQPATVAAQQASPQPRPQQQQQQRAGPSQPPAEQPAPEGPAGADIRKPPEGTGAEPSEVSAPPSYADALRGDNKIQSHE